MHTLKSVWLITLLFFILLKFSSCSFENRSDTDFYSEKKESDLWRVPLLEPYEIVSPNNADDWFLILTNHEISGPDFISNKGEFQFTKIIQIGIKDSVIVVENKDQHWPKLSGMYSSVLIIDAHTNKCFMYSKEHHEAELNLKYKELDLENMLLHPWSKIRKNYQEKNKLPTDWKR